MNTQTHECVWIFRHAPHEGPGLITNILRANNLRYFYRDLWKHATHLPSIKNLAALIVMGGPMSVYEQNKHPYLKKEITFIRRVIKAEKPVLGICLGSQLIAAALNERVYPNRHKEIGWHPIHLSRAARHDPLFRRAPAHPTVFQWHGDTFDLPRRAVRLAASPLCRNQAFRYGSRVYALQFHPEITAEMVRNWLRQPGARTEINRSDPENNKKIRLGLRTQLPAMHRWAIPLFHTFVHNIVRGSKTCS